ncbi:MAG TPA: hypothetical protein P5571_14695 [Candidatus Krumholzibacteria bacterium]|nr:hypothetical protein [Candidatus Krumholzibacteria bacterium]
MFPIATLIASVPSFRSSNRICAMRITDGFRDWNNALIFGPGIFHLRF